MKSDYQRINDETLKKLISQLKGSKKEQLDFLYNERAKRTKEKQAENPELEVEYDPELDAYGMLYQAIGNDRNPNDLFNDLFEESNPQAEVRYKTPEDLMIPTMSDEDLANSIDGIERGQSDLTDAEKPIALGWIKDEMKKRKSAIDTNDNGKIEVDEMADFQKSLDDYASKNKKGREDIPATYKR